MLLLRNFRVIGVDVRVSSDLLLVGEDLHSVQQRGDSGGDQADRHGLCHVLSRQVEHASCGHQVHVQGGGVALHRTHHQLQETARPSHNHTWTGPHSSQL